MTDHYSVKALLNWRLHTIVILSAVVSELVGIKSIPIGSAELLFLPLFYAFLICLLFNPNITRFSAKLITKKQASIATSVLAIGILPFIAKFGTLIGPALPRILGRSRNLLCHNRGRAARHRFHVSRRAPASARLAFTSAKAGGWPRNSRTN